MTRSVFSFSNAGFRYPRSDRPVLEALSLEVNAGEFIGVVGPTGCGKTTLLKLMAGVIPHFESGEPSGDVRIFGEPLASWTLPRLSEKIGFVMEDPEDQVFNLRVHDEVIWGLENRGLPADEIRARAREALKFFDIAHLEDRVTCDLSGGEKQRLALASIYAIAPDAMLLDKPTSELDPGGTEQVLEAIRSLRSAGKTVVIVEDKIDFLLSCCDRVVLLANGRALIDSPPEAFARQLADCPDIPVKNSDAVVAALAMGRSPLEFVSRAARR